MKYNSDVFLGLFFVVLGLVAWLVLLPRGVEASAFGDLAEAGWVGPRLLPTLVSLAMVVVGAMLSLRALLVRGKARSVDGPKNEKAAEPSITKRLSVVVGFVAVCLGYVLFIYVLGYMVATIVLLVFLQWFFGERRRTVLVFTPALLSLGLYLVFRYALLVHFPQGRLFVLMGWN